VEKIYQQAFPFFEEGKEQAAFEQTALEPRAGAGKSPALDQTPGADGPKFAAGRPLSDRVAHLARFEDLESLRREAQQCQACRLRSTCQRVVFGEGNPQATILFVGEAPGAQEDEEGKPFVGAAGQLLTRIFEAAGLAREEVFITNTVMCRPPQNRLPLPDEVQACRPYLDAKIRLIKPKIIVALGALASRTLINPAEGITKIRGQWFEKDGIKLTATFHPAALLRDPSKKRPVWEDFKTLVEVYRRLKS